MKPFFKQANQSATSMFGENRIDKDCYYLILGPASMVLKTDNCPRYHVLLNDGKVVNVPCLYFY